MRNKTVIGLNLEHFLKALIAIVIGFISLLLPFTSKEAGRKNMVSTAASVLSAEHAPVISFFLYLAVVLTVVSLLVGIASYIWTSVKIVRCWMYVQICATFFWTMLLFAAKVILDESGVESNFLLKNAGVGFWLGLIAAYVSLVFIMKVAEVNVGYIILTILGVIWMFPILWILLTALRAEQGYYVGYFFPKHLTLKNFYDLFHNTAVPFGKWWLNTMIVAVCGCVLNTLIVLGTAFVLSRTRFSGRKPFMNILMIIGMFPGFMSMVALYNILKGLGMNQSIGALIVVGAAGAAMGYHITKGFFDTIPKAIDEAAIIDGASRLQIFTRITIPLSKSIIVYQVLGTFLGAWSDYIFPRLLFGDRQSSYTVAVGLFWMTDFRRIDSYYTQFAAGAVVIAVPIVILFIWLQRFYVEGLSGSVKG
ncbi:MAG: ABC transporter permease subunit [Butyrivibrio sp.]|uniref:sugar ABC transporter permease n=1 Tax=Butyrivibrio sp. TaxID=28121 RepID=UPI001B593981|nr:ABC transporter permease subunit [Butyrivibrio sp.]MBP3783149.1 ABC transporter permease subunit [Butyrivibrio sp.]MBP3813196.1 ABC transporter permease subunit [Butyrivibrio sp.]